MGQVRVLVIDDDPFVRDLVGEMLAFDPYQVSSASDGDEGLEAVERTRPDVVLLDVDLGGSPDGFEVCRRIVAQDGAPPVIFLTGYAGEERRREGLQAGGRAYLSKPFSPLELLEQVKAARGAE